jgi:hypothetical protein
MTPEWRSGELRDRNFLVSCQHRVVEVESGSRVVGTLI